MSAGITLSDVAAAEAFQFSVSAPAPEVFDWLLRRAERSGEMVAGSTAAGSFGVRWSAAAHSGRPETLQFSVRSVGARHSRVTVTVPAAAESPRAAIEEFAGPLGDRMSPVSACRGAFFDPPRTRGDDVVLVAWGCVLLTLLAVAAATRHIPGADETMSGREAIDEIVLPLVAAAFAAGFAGGLLWRVRGRWYEVIVFGLALGWIASFLVFDQWFVALDSGPHSGSGSSNFALAIGAGLCAVPSALVVLAGVGAGRTPVALVRLARRVAA